MATSGSIDYVVDRDEIITEALEQLGVLGEGESPTAAQLTSMSRKLNMLVKAWQADGLNLFAVQKIYVFLQSNQHEFGLSSSSTDHLTANLVRTEMKVAGVATDTTIDVDSITGISNGDYIGVAQDDGTIHWTTVNGAPSGDTITLTAALTDAAAIDNAVYTYTTKANRPMKILNAVVRNGDDTDRDITQLYRSEYVELSNKTTDGPVNQYYYDPQVSEGKLYVWPENNNMDEYLVLWVQRTLEDFDAATDDADFPQEWYLALSFNLAVVAMNAYGVPPSHKSYLTNMATYFKEQAESFDTEGGFTIEPERVY